MPKILRCFLAFYVSCLSLFSTVYGQTFYPVEWTDLVNANVNANNSLTHAGEVGWTAGAASANELLPGVDGEIQFTVVGTSDIYMVGLSKINTDVHFNSIDYAVYINPANTIYIYESGARIASYGVATAGDLLKIVRQGDNLIYYHNSAILRQITLSNAYEDSYLIDVSIQEGRSPVIQASFDIKLKVHSNITPVNASGSGGSIQVTPQFGSAPYTYQWNTGETSSTITNKSLGVYTVTVQDAAGRTAVKSFSLGHKTDWTNISNNLTLNADNSLTKGGAPAWDAGASSTNVLMEGSDGWIEFTYTMSNAAYQVGLSRSDINVSNASIENGIYLVSGNITIFELGTSQGNFGKVKTGDLLKITREGSSIKYYHNGFLLRETAASMVQPNYLVVDASLYSNGAVIPPVYTSFDAQVKLERQITPVNASGTAGAIEMLPTGGTAPYTYSWSTGETTRRIENKPVGAYHVTVTDAEGRTASMHVSLGYEIDWTDPVKLTVQPDNTLLTHPPASSLWDSGAGSINRMLPNTDGWIEFVIDHPTNKYEVGLSVNDVDETNTYISAGFVVNPTNGYVSIYEGTTFIVHAGLIKVGDIYKIAREGASLNYYRNGDLVRTRAISTVAQYVVDVSIIVGRTPVIYSSFDTAPVMFPTITPVDQNHQNGSISITVKGGTAPYQINWSTGETGAILSGKEAGTYSATVTDAEGRTSTQSYSIGHPIVWTNLVKMSRNANYTLLKNYNIANWNAGASSRNKLAANEDGWIEFVAPKPGDQMLIGLSYADANVSISSNQYGFWFSPSGAAGIYETGDLKLSMYFNPGDVFAIKRTGSTIQYYVNNQLLRSVATDGARNLYVDVSVVSPYSTVPAITGSFQRQLLAIDQKIRYNWAFEYKYDARKRMIAKKVPGAEWVYMIYDNRDRIVLTQDGNQRIANQWTCTKYDAFNRPIMTGLYKHTGSEATQEEMQNHVNGQLNAPEKYYEEWEGTDGYQGYTNRAFPTTDFTPLTVTYYDNYLFKSLFNDARFDFISDHLDGQEDNIFDRIVGQITGTKVRTLGDNIWMRAVNYYDEKYRVIQKLEEDHQGRVSRYTSRYDFVGKVMETASTEHQSYDVIWMSLRGTRLEDKKLIATNADTWSSGARSFQTLPASQDGWVETVLDENVNTAMFGFADADPNAGIGSLDYAAYLSAGGVLYAYSNGTMRAHLAKVKKGDVVRVERVSGKVFIRLNGNNLYQYGNESSAALFVDVSIHKAGDYLRDVKASFGADKTLAHALRWIYATRISLSTGMATKTNTNDWDGFASSLNLLSGPGWLEFKATERTKSRMAGLASITPITSWGQLNYAIYLKSTGQFDIRENGQIAYTPSEVEDKDKYFTGDIFRIESDGTKVTYYRNGNVIYESTIAPTKGYRAQLAMYSNNGTIGEMKVSFGIPMDEIKTDLYTRFEYDHAGRLLEEWHRVNQDNEILLADHEYNELGQLVTKKLYSPEPEGTQDENRTFKQHIDYRHNIRGWLTRMNNSDLSPDEGNEPKDLFGMELAYEKPVTGLNNEVAFNGNISAIKWSNNLGLGGIDNPIERAYRFTYDPMNRLKDAHHLEQSATWASSSSYHEQVLEYDLNGNIQELQRSGDDGLNMDALVYDYGEGLQRSNRLLKVADNGDDTKGFKDGSNTSLDYNYDANGNMISDLNKNIQSITYNHLNLPSKVTKTSGEYIKYLYDATGRKLNQQVYDASNALQKKSDYIGSLVLENDTTKFINHREGRIIPADDEGEANEYQYNLKDHLGNVRLTFTTKDEIDLAIATMETVNTSNEQSKFIYYDEAVTVNQDLFDHTYNGTTGETYYATRLTGGNTNAKYGLAKSLSVMPGDEITTEVHAKYIDANPDNWTAALATLMASIANGTAPPGTVIDGGSAGSIGTGNLPFAPVDHGAETGTPPKAYLNYIVFNHDMTVALDLGFKRITTDSRETGNDVAHDKLAFEGDEKIVIKEPGYVYIYLSNENETEVEVFFDDFKVEHVKSPVIQTDDYYPFGLQFNHYQRENSDQNKYLFNGGSELQTDLDLGWYSTLFRTYDPATGRFMQIDPLADFFPGINPYNFALDNPILYGDPDGLGPIKDFFQRLFNPRTQFIKVSVNGKMKQVAVGRKPKKGKPDGTASSNKGRSLDPGIHKPRPKQDPPVQVNNDKPIHEDINIDIEPETYTFPQESDRSEDFAGKSTLLRFQVFSSNDYVVVNEKQLKENLSPIAEALRDNPQLAITIQVLTNLKGDKSLTEDKLTSKHTDLTGSQLLDRRGQAIMRALMRMGVDQKQMVYMYVPDTDPDKTGIKIVYRKRK